MNVPPRPQVPHLEAWTRSLVHLQDWPKLCANFTNTVFKKNKDFQSYCGANLKIMGQLRVTFKFMVGLISVRMMPRQKETRSAVRCSDHDHVSQTDRSNCHLPPAPPPQCTLPYSCVGAHLISSFEPLLPRTRLRVMTVFRI